MSKVRHLSGRTSFRRRLLLLIVGVSLLQVFAAFATFGKTQATPQKLRYESEMSESVQRVLVTVAGDELDHRQPTLAWGAADVALRTAVASDDVHAIDARLQSTGLDLKRQPLYVTDAHDHVIAGTRPDMPLVEGDTVRFDGPAGAERRLHAPVVLDAALLARANRMTSDVLFAANDGVLVTAKGREVAPKTIPTGYSDLRLGGQQQRALVRATSNGTVVGAAVPTSVMAAASRSARTQLWLFFAALTGLVVLVAWIVTSAVDGALAVFATRARQVSGGELDERIPVVGNDQVAAASEAFNTMAAALKDRIEGLEAAEARLDRQVHLFGDVLTSEDAVEGKLHAVCEVATETTGADYVRFWLRGEAQLVVAAQAGPAVAHALLAPHEVATLRERTMTCADVDGISVIVAPAVRDDECIGMLTLCSTEDALTPRDRELALRLAAQAAVAIDNAQLHDELRDEHKLLATSFSQYVPASVVEQLLERGETVELGGQQRDVTVLFCDIRGFTAWSEQLQPTEVVRELNDLLAVLADCVFETEGTLDKFTGDGLMALWSAPLDQPDHADRACATAMLMQQRLDEFNAARDDHEFRIGIGIHSGPAVVGNIGHHRRHDYTAIGDTVNLSARIEAATKELGSTVLISSDTLERTTDTTALGFEQVGAISVKGRTQQVVVHCPIEQAATLLEAA